MARTRSFSASSGSIWKATSSSTVCQVECGVSPKESVFVSLLPRWLFVNMSVPWNHLMLLSVNSSGVPGKVCLPPDLPEGMTVHPLKDEYRVGQSVGLSCAGDGLFPVPSGRHTCGTSLTWEPPFSEELRCSDGTLGLMRCRHVTRLRTMCLRLFDTGSSKHIKTEIDVVHYTGNVIQTYRKRPATFFYQVHI